MRVLFWLSVSLVFYGVGVAVVFRGIPALGELIVRHINHRGNR